MKNVLLTIVCIFIIQIAQSQDIILMKNGDEVKSKVLEINENVIKYKKADNPDGPTFSILKSDVMMIKYVNGTKDVFNNTETQSANPEIKEVPKAKEFPKTGLNKRPPQRLTKFLNITQMGFSKGIGSITYPDPFSGGYSYPNKNNIVNISTINGIKINDYFFTGLGLSLDYYFDDGSHNILLPVYLDLRTNILGENMSPVIYFDIGKSFNIKDSENLTGLIMEPGFGLKFPVDDIGINLSLGYTIQKGSYYFGYPYNKKSYTLNFISFKIGVSI